MLHVALFRDENCPCCDEALAELRSLEPEFPEMRIRVRQVEEEPELVHRLGIVATPAIVVNDQLAFQGHPGREALATYLRNVRQGLHRDPYAFPPPSERVPEARGEAPLGSMDPEWRGSGRRPAFGSHPGGRH